MGYNFLLQEIFLTQGLNPRLLCLLHWQVNSLPRSHLGSPRSMVDTLNHSTRQGLREPKAWMLGDMGR